MQDITTEADIKTLVDRFYEKVVVNPVIGFIFTEIIVLSWDKHIPIMNNFWSSVLLGTHTYTGNPMQQHIELNRRIELEKRHFDTWLELWEKTVHENFEGRVASEAISRAKNIATLMQHKIETSKKKNNLL